MGCEGKSAEGASGKWKSILKRDLRKKRSLPLGV